jgi:hypothetical protein
LSALTAGPGSAFRGSATATRSAALRRAGAPSVVFAAGSTAALGHGSSCASRDAVALTTTAAVDFVIPLLVIVQTNDLRAGADERYRTEQLKETSKPSHRRPSSSRS